MNMKVEIELKEVGMSDGTSRIEASAVRVNGVEQDLGPMNVGTWLIVWSRLWLRGDN